MHLLYVKVCKVRRKLYHIYYYNARNNNENRKCYKLSNLIYGLGAVTQVPALYTAVPQSLPGQTERDVGN